MKQTRNVILVFLTMFHHKLDYLVDDISENEESENEESKKYDREWATIRSFFKFPDRLVQLVSETEKMVMSRQISPEHFEKALTIYDTVLKPDDEDSKPTGIEERIFMILEKFLFRVFQMEEEISGVQYVTPFQNERGEKAHRKINSVIPEVPEDEEESRITSMMDARTRKNSEIP